MPRFIIQNLKVVDDNASTYNTEYVTAFDVRQYLQLDGSSYDNVLDIMAKAARKSIEAKCNVSLVPKMIEAVIFVPTVSTPVPLPYTPVNTISQVRYKPECGCGDWVVATGWEQMDEQHVVVPVHGYYEFTYSTDADGNEAFRNAVIIQAAHLFTHRDEGYPAEISPLAEGLLGPVSKGRY